MKDRLDFYNKCRELALAELGFYPELVEAWFILKYMLNIDPDIVVTGSLTKKTYKVFKFNDGQLIMHKGKYVSLTRKFTREQQKVVAEMWPLIPAGAKR